MTYDNLMGWIEDNYDIDDYDNYSDWVADVRDNFIFEEHVLPKQAEDLMREKWEESKGEPAILERESEPVEIDTSRRGREERVYDTRDAVRNVQVATNQEGDAIVSVDSQESPQQTQQRLSESIQSQEIRKQSLASRIKSAIVNAFRRKR